MKKITIYGERCSGTNYLEELLLLNFDVEIVWDYGWKHFFGFHDLRNSHDTLFIGIIRNIEDWLNSLYREKHHLPKHLTETIDTYLNNTFYSFDDDKNEIMFDRNINTGKRYKNIFELRLVKNKFLIEKMPILVKNYCFITYDILVNNFNDTMNKLKNCGLKSKDNIHFPLNVLYFKKEKNIPFKKKENSIPKEKIKKIITENKELEYYEKMLFPEKDL
jgi:hypothetical protein